jgi:hypothetical protein
MTQEDVLICPQAPILKPISFLGRDQIDFS